MVMKTSGRVGRRKSRRRQKKDWRDVPILRCQRAEKQPQSLIGAMRLESGVLQNRYTGSALFWLFIFDTDGLPIRLVHAYTENRDVD